MRSDTITMEREIQELTAEVERLRAELAALQARGCRGCGNWRYLPGSIDEGFCFQLETDTKADFACVWWDEKE